MRPPLPFFFTTSWVIYVRAGCRLFLLSPSRPLAPRNDAGASPSKVFIFQSFRRPTKALHYFTLRRASFSNYVETARVSWLRRLDYDIFTRNNTQIRPQRKRRHAFIRNENNLNARIILIDLTYIPDNATISRSYSAADTLVRVYALCARLCEEL